MSTNVAFLSSGTLLEFLQETATRHHAACRPPQCHTDDNPDWDSRDGGHSTFTVGIQPFWLRMKNLPPLTVDPVIEAYKKDVDRSLLRENLKLTPTQRIRKLMELQRFAAQVREGGRRMRERND